MKQDFHPGTHQARQARKLCLHSRRPFRKPVGDRPPFAISTWPSRGPIWKTSSRSSSASANAQKHPDEDWAETFAVWMTPGLDWKTEYQAWPMALAKLNYCDRIMGVLKGKEPIVAITELDEDVAELSYSVEDFYRQQALGEERLPPGLDGAVR